MNLQSAAVVIASRELMLDGDSEGRSPYKKAEISGTPYLNSIRFGLRLPPYISRPGILRSGYKAQNNTQTVFTDADSVSRFQTELITEHLAARDQESAAVPAGERQRRPLISQLPGIRAGANARARGRTPSR